MGAEQSLINLELRMDSLVEHEGSLDVPSSMDCINVAKNLQSLKVWGELMTVSPKWDGFGKLHTLEIVGARLEEDAMTSALQACPNLTNLLLLGCEGLRSAPLNCNFWSSASSDFYGAGNCSLSVVSPKIKILKIQGRCWIRVPETRFLQNLSISNNAGRVYEMDFGKLPLLDFLSIRGIQRCWDAINNILQLATEVEHLFRKVEFTGDFESFTAFPRDRFCRFL